MKVLLVNTSEKTGGAAMACGRIAEAVRKKGIEASVMVRNLEGAGAGVITAGTSLHKQWSFLSERAVIWAANRFRSEGIFYVDIANAGIDITRTQAFREADIIHLNWINQGFISLRGLEKIVKSGKPIVWTMHDMWPFTGICHHADSCTKYTSECRDCPMLPKRGLNDLARNTFERKLHILEKANISFVGCSRWLAGLCSNSSIAKGHKVVSIPNPIDTDAYAPADKYAIRRKLNLPLDKKLVMFSAVKTTDVRKGMEYFRQTCEILHSTGRSDIEILILGKNSDALSRMLPLPSRSIGFVDNGSSLAEFYNAADVFVTPSLQENLPNTIMESLACGVPCAGFDIGGIPEMIDHRKNGYVASYKSAEDLAEGICWILDNNEYQMLCTNARAKVLTEYSEKTIASQYISLYKSLM